MNTSMVYLLLLPEIYFIFLVLFFLTYTTIVNLSKTYSFPNNTKNYLFFFLLCIINVTFLVLNYINIGEFNILQYVQKDNFASILQLITLFFTFLLSFLMYDYLKHTKFNQFELYVLFLFAALSICLLVISNHMTTLYLVLELQGFSFYILTAYNKNNQYSVESGLKYYILGSFSSVLLLFGISFIYGFTGLLSFQEIEIFLSNFNYYIKNISVHFLHISFLFVMVSFLFKLYAAPFHLWVSDIYQGAPTMVTAYFASVPLISTFYIFSKLLLNTFYSFNSVYSPILGITIVCCIVLGTFGALYQKKIKRLLAYSSVTGLGYFLTMFLSDSGILTSNVFTYLFLYSFSLFTLFSLLLQLFLKKKNTFIENVSMLNGYFKNNMFISLLFLFIFFTLAGVPPFSLFISKLFLLTSIAYLQMYQFLFLAIIFTILSGFYYLKIVKIIYFNNFRSWDYFAKISYVPAFIISFSILLQFLFFLNPSIILVFFQYVSYSLI